MLLNEVLQPVVPVFHLTGIHQVINILKTQSFKLAGGHSGSRGKYHLSVARSTQSIFVTMMAARGSVIITLNRTMLSNNNKIEPYKCMDADEEGWHDEMEDRVYSSTPTIRLRSPLNHTILNIRALGKPYTTKGASYSFTQADVDHLKTLCQQHHIPLQFWSEDDEDAFIRGR